MKLEAAMKCARLQWEEPPLGVEEAWKAFAAAGAAVQFLAERQKELACSGQAVPA
jgi:hypothetical protein